MALEVGSAFVTILPTLDKFTPAMQQEFRGVERQATVSGKRAGDNFTGRMGSSFKRLGGLLAGALLIKGVKDLATFGLEVAANNEQARISFTTMLGSAQKADKFLRNLQAFAAKTPFEFPELQTAASSLISAGVEARKVIPIMTTLGDVTSGMGTGSEGVQRATVALQQMNAAGRITGEDLNQLRDAGIPVYDLLAAATGKSKQEVVALSKEGKLGAKALAQLMGALESGKGLERFSGLMDKQSQSLNGVISTFKDTLGQGLARAMEPLIPIIKDGILWASERLAVVLPKVSGAIQGAISGFKNGAGAGGAVRDAFLGIAEALRGLDWISIAATINLVFTAITKNLSVVGSLNSIITLTNQIIGFFARHLDTVIKLLPYLAAGWALYLVVARAANTLGQFSVVVRVAEVVAIRQQTKALRVLASAQRGGTIATVGQNTAENVGLLTRIRTTAATIASTVAQKAAAAATKVWAGVQWLLNAAMTANPIGLVVLAVAALVAGVIIAWKRSETFRRIVTGAFDAVRRAAVAVWEWLKKNWPLLLAIITGPVGLAVRWVIKHWDRIKAAFSSAVSFVTGFFRRAWDGLKLILTDPVEAAKNLLNNLLGNGGPIRRAFSAAVDAIGRIWDGLKKLAAKPVNFIIDTVYNKGIWSLVDKLPGANPLRKAEQISFASGGVLPGWTPGRDVHHFVSPTGGRLNLSGGEAIMRPEFTRAVGGPSGVDRLNALARGGRSLSFWKGGVFPLPGGAVTNFHGYDYYGAQWAGDLNKPGGDRGAIIRAFQDGVVAAVRHWGVSYGNHVVVNHANGVNTLYAHMLRTLVAPGQSVKAGQILGRVGDTGNAQGDHLHFEIRGGSIRHEASEGNWWDSLGGSVGALFSKGKSLVQGLSDVLPFGKWADKLRSMSGGWGSIFATPLRAMFGNVREWIMGRLTGLRDSVMGNHESLRGLPISGVIDIVRAVAGRRGWDTDAQWTALARLVHAESSWNPTAKNPRSSAYGLFQFLDATWGTVGGRKTDDPRLQAIYGLRYIAERYGSPLRAWAHHMRVGSYDSGGVLEPGAWAYNGSNRPEAVFNYRQFRALMEGRNERVSAYRVTITNWNDGSGYMRQIADDSFADQYGYVETRRRMLNG